MLFDFVRSNNPPVSPPASLRYLSGVSQLNGSPVSRFICVFNRKTLTLLAAQWSHPTTGVWKFIGLPDLSPTKVMVIDLDLQNNVENGRIFDQVTPSLTP